MIFLLGSRRTGKTTLLNYYKNLLEQKGHSTYYLNLENPDNLTLCEYYKKFTNTFLDVNTKIYIFLDEIQLHKNPSNFLKLFI